MTAAREADPIDQLMSEMTVHRFRQKAAPFGVSSTSAWP